MNAWKFGIALLCISPLLHAQSELAMDYLPPLMPWQGASEALIQPEHPWVTPAERSGLRQTPDYAQTIQYLQALVQASPELRLEQFGTSPQGRALYVVKASLQPDLVGRNGKPLLLVQAGIHSGEIDGKDAGLMLLRDIVRGSKKQLLKDVDLLFIPILSVDAHERKSTTNRINQRGPVEQGWRSTSQNINLNRDYGKLDSAELQAVIGLINQYDPDLYLDIHVTDGEDYQYDVTYGFNHPQASQSPNAASWLSQVYRPVVDQALTQQGHIPGPLVFALDNEDFAKGISGWTATLRFSNGYGDFRHLPTVLVENHSLKPYRQRVLGTYVLLEATLKLLAEQGSVLKLARQADSSARPLLRVLQFTASKTAQPIAFKGIDYQKVTSRVLGTSYVQWTGKPRDYEALPQYWDTEPVLTSETPKAYWIPPQYQEVITRLQRHGIQMTELTESKTMQLQRLTASQMQFGSTPLEGRMTVKAEFSADWPTVELAKGSQRVDMDQPLAALAMALLQPQGPDSFFSWGFFNSMFERTEYFERYAFIPWAEAELKKNKAYAQAFAAAKKADAGLAKDAKKQMDWLYQHSPFYDQSYLRYPVLIER